MAQSVTIENSGIIFDEIQKAKNILLHCHPNPDGDSLGSSLAMHHALKGMGKSVAVIKGDSPKPEYLKNLPGYAEIIEKNFFELELSDFDLFIILDAASLGMVSRMGEVMFPDQLKTIVVDHHVSNEAFAQINLIDSSSPATCQILYELFKKWGIEITHDIGLCLMTGMYTDTGGFKYKGTTYRTFSAAAECAQAAPDYIKILFEIENSNTQDMITAKGLMLNSVEVFAGTVAFSCLSNKEIHGHKINLEHVQSSDMANTLKSAIGWDIGISLVEESEGKTKASMRTRDPETYDVSVLAKKLGGGGHKAAAGVLFSCSVDEAKAKIKQALLETYPSLSEKS